MQYSARPRLVVLAMSIAFAMTAAIAAVSLDPFSGTGFVGRGDVQTALATNNPPVDPSFTFRADFQLAQECVKEVEVGRDREIRRLEHSFSQVRAINSSVEYETRRNKGNGNITGYTLLGFTDSLSFPATLCPNHESGWAPVGDLQLVSQGGELFVNGSSLGRF